MALIHQKFKDFRRCVIPQVQSCQLMPRVVRYRDIDDVMNISAWNFADLRPAIKVPGLPLLGSLVEFGNNHAKVAQNLAKKYGPVFQVRLGNRVSLPTHFTTVQEEVSIC